MTSDVANNLKSFFLILWNLLGSFTFPGTELTGQHLLVAPLGALAFVTVLKKILDIGGVGVSQMGSIGSSSNYYPEYDNKEQGD